MAIMLRLWMLAIGAAIASAFRDTSPFMLFSSSEILFPSSQFSTASSLSESISSELSKCHSDIYIVAHQPGVNIRDYNELNAAPFLKDWFNGRKWVRSSGHVSEVQGQIDPTDLVKQIEKDCSAEARKVHVPTEATWDNSVGNHKQSQVALINFEPPPPKDVTGAMVRTNDAFFHVFLSSLPNSSKITVLYTTTSPGAAKSLHVEKPATYEMDDSQSSIHLDLKRDLGSAPRAANGNVTLVDGPLFERYQYFTPGIFMGLLAMVFILSIAFVGVSALQSLQVSYAAFDKDNGPAAQKKQQ